MRAAITARVSLDPRGQGRSVDEQLAESRAWAAREGWDVVAEVTETGSASRYARSTGARTRWADITTLLASGTIDILITWEASRATRQLEEYTVLRELCATHGVLWGYSGTVHDLTKRDARFRTGLDILLAEDESARTSERVLRSARARAVAGAPHGKLPYGYRREYDTETGRLLRQVPDETTAPIAREIIERVAAGDTLYTIAHDLTARGIPLPRPARGRSNAHAWIPTTVRRIATSPTYAGLRVHQGRVVGPAAWPALVDRETHEKAVAAVTAMNTAAPRADRTTKWLLSGIARCGLCGGPMIRIKNRGTPSYSCKVCFKVTRRQDAVDQHVTDRLLQLLPLIDQPTTPTADTHPDLAAAEADLEQLHTRLATFIDQAADGSLSSAALARVEARLQPRIDDAERRVRALRRPPALARYDLTDPAALWESLDVGERRTLLAATLDVKIWPTTRRGVRTFDPTRIEVRPRW